MACCFWFRPRFNPCISSRGAWRLNRLCAVMSDERISFDRPPCLFLSPLIISIILLGFSSAVCLAHSRPESFLLKNSSEEDTMAANETSVIQDTSVLSDKDTPNIKSIRGDDNRPSTGNGKTLKNQKCGLNGEMKIGKAAMSNTSVNNNSRHPPKLPTRTNKTKKRSAGTTEGIPKTTIGLSPAQPSSSASRPAAPLTRHHRALNPLLLARGMSSRYLSTKIISASSNSSTTPASSANVTATSILPLSKTEIEKDLRHIEAYRAASIGYGQQLFVYKNQELVRSGYFGSFFVGPGVLEDGSGGGGEHVAGGDGYQQAAASMVVDDTIHEYYQDEENEDSVLLHRVPTRPGGGKRGPSSHRQHQQQSQQHNRGRPYMPIKIDPEEEKRLSGLRKRMHHSEFVRMQLETQYLSLRSHYVHESQLVRKTRSYEMEGRLKLMREVMVRREKVLALMRVKMAISRDVEVKLMGYRDGWNVAGTEDDTNIEKEFASAPTGKKAEKANEGANCNADNENNKVDLLKIWSDINAQLKAAEAACMEFETPSVLTQMVVTPTPTPPSSSTSSATSIAKNGRNRSGSVTSTEESANSSNELSSGKRRVSLTGLEPHIIPWDCMVEPQTPYDFPLLLSCLSSATDKVAGYGEFRFVIMFYSAARDFA